jgi:HlyD family secretion protein
MTDALGITGKWRRSHLALGSVAIPLRATEAAWRSGQRLLSRAVAALRVAEGPRQPGRRAARRAAAALGFVGASPPRRGEPPEPDLDDILFEQPPRLMRGPHYVIVAMFLSLLLLAAVLNVDVIVVATGRLVADGPPIVVQPLELSVIRDIRVKAGDIVREGEVLASLDATFTEADSASLTEQQKALEAQIRRLEAELAGTPLTAGGGTPDEKLQLDLYGQRRAQFASRLDGLDAEIARDRTAIAATEKAQGLLSHQLDIARQKEAMRGELFKGKVGSKLNYLDAQATRIQAQHDYQDQLSKMAELQQSLRAAEADRETFADTWHRELLEDLAKAQSEHSKVTESLAKAVRRNDLVVLKAPADGIVLDIAKRSVGSVLHEAEPLITLVPLGTPLIAEVMIASSDVGYAKLGDPVVVKVDAFPFQRHGMLDGRLRTIGEDSSIPGNGLQGSAPATAGVFHRSEVSLTSTALRDLPEGTHLIPGMTATAEIKVGSRSVLSCILNPLLRNVDESFREP